jgi:hypothetical protein
MKEGCTFSAGFVCQWCKLTSQNLDELCKPVPGEAVMSDDLPARCAAPSYGREADAHSCGLATRLGWTPARCCAAPLPRWRGWSSNSSGREGCTDMHDFDGMRVVAVLGGVVKSMLG